MTCDEDDGDEEACLYQLLLQIQSTHTGQADVEDEARGHLRTRDPQKFFRGTEGLDVETDGSNQSLQGRGD